VYGYRCYHEEAENNMYEAGITVDKFPIPESNEFAEYIAVAEKSDMEQMA